MNTYFKEVLKKIVKRNGKKVLLKKRNLLSLNEDIQIRMLGFVIKSLNKSDYPPDQKDIKCIEIFE